MGFASWLFPTKIAVEAPRPGSFLPSLWCLRFFCLESHPSFLQSSKGDRMGGWVARFVYCVLFRRGIESAFEADRELAVSHRDSPRHLPPHCHVKDLPSVALVREG